MSFKSVFRAAGEFFGNLGAPVAQEPHSPVSPELQRLTGRSDWAPQSRPVHAPFLTHVAPAPMDGDGSDLIPPWDAVKAGREALARAEAMGPDKWPATDDPYANPEPCEIVPDPAIANIGKLTERGLTGPLPTMGSVTDLITLIERQEAAELHLTKLGMVWTRERGWHLPDPDLA